MEVVALGEDATGVAVLMVEVEEHESSVVLAIDKEWTSVVVVVLVVDIAVVFGFAVASAASNFLCRYNRFCCLINPTNKNVLVKKKKKRSAHSQRKKRTNDEFDLPKNQYTWTGRKADKAHVMGPNRYKEKADAIINE